ncbi:MAG: alpha/beta fold hydrolase, partial [Trueperaceae bacterium]|nr:alpha/beta fold hydrolase [Trueperaceae bacterium]
MSTPHTTDAPRNAPPLKAFAPVPRAGARSLARPDGTLAYDDTGTGPLVVMLPGLGDLRQGYRFLTPHLARAGYRAVSADLRGHGDSSTNWPDYGSEAAGHDLVALIEELGGGRAVVVGNSFG